MLELKIKVKYGDYELEAEGLADAVERQMIAFQRLVSPPPPEPVVIAAPVEPKPAPEPLTFDTVLRVKENIVSLKCKADPVRAVLAILFGQRQHRHSDSVSGREIMEGLRDSGIDIVRADTILKRYAERGLVVGTGRLRLRRYRLTSDGQQRAIQILGELAKQQAPAATTSNEPR
jgi:hypothetical protein